MKWISVKERLPECNELDWDNVEQSEEILVCNSRAVFIAIYKQGIFGEYNREGEFFELYNGATEEITHWMHTPQIPPKAQKYE